MDHLEITQAMKNRILRRLDRAYLRFTNLFRDTKLSYIEKVGTIHAKNGQVVFTGWNFDCLGRAKGIEISDDGLMKMGGWNTGVICKPEKPQFYDNSLKP